MIYLDTSVLVSALTTEVATSRAQEWLKKNALMKLCISPWVITEINSALGMKLRLKIINADERRRISQEFEYLRRMQLHIVNVENGHFQNAAEYCSQEKLALRASDALHIAIAASHGASLCTLDQALFDAGKALGVSCVMP